MQISVSSISILSLYPKFLAGRENSSKKGVVSDNTQEANGKYLFLDISTFYCIRSFGKERENFCKKGPASNTLQEANIKYLCQVFLLYHCIPSFGKERENFCKKGPASNWRLVEDGSPGAQI